MGVYDEHGNINKSDSPEYTAMKLESERKAKLAKKVKDAKEAREFVTHEVLSEKEIIDKLYTRNIDDGNFGIRF